MIFIGANSSLLPFSNLNTNRRLGLKAIANPYLILLCCASLFNTAILSTFLIYKSILGSMKNARLNANAVFLLFVSTSIVNAQTGPGGVGDATNNVLWLDANHMVFSDAGVTPATNNANVRQWNDKSGNGKNAVQATVGNRPNYIENAINGYPAIRYTKANNDRLVSSGVSNTNRASVWFVASYSSLPSTNPGLMQATPSGEAITNNAGSKSIGIWMGNDNKIWGRGIQSNNTIRNLFKNLTQSANTNYIFSTIYRSNRIDQYVNHQTSGNNTDHNGTLKSWTDVCIGQQGGNESWNGDIAEVIMFNTEVNLIQRIIIDNYLSAKYNRSLHSNDFYAYKTTFNGNVIGIGQASDGSSHTNSKGDGILTISNPSALANGDYLFVGHNKQNAEYEDLCSQASAYEYQLKRVWRLTETGEVGTVDFAFDLTGLSGLGTESQLVLLISTNSDFSGATVHTTGRDLTGNTLSFTGVNLNDSNYFTIAQEGISFSAGVWHKGSGAGNAPNTTDGNKKVYIADVGAQIAIDASCRCLHVDTGKDLTVNGSKSIFVSDGIVNNGTITVKNTASIVQTASSNTNSGSGTYEIERTGINIDSAYNIWSSPIQSANILSTYPQTNPCDMYAFESNSQSWKWDYTVGFNTTCVGNPVTFQNQHVLVGGDGLMDVARGYFIPGSDINPTRTFSGQINNASIQKAVTLAVNPGGVPWTGDHWNLVGNPYPSALNCHAFWQENAVNNSRISGALYFWDQDTILNYNQNDYAVWSPLGVVAGPNTAKTPNNNIASGQGFWVIADVNSNLVFNNSMRSDTNTMFFKREANEVSKLWLSLSNAEREYNEILIGFPQDASKGLDRLYDAPKMESTNKLYLASRIGDKDFVVQGSEPVNFLDNKREIQLHIKTNEEGNYQIQIEKAEFMSKIKVFLYAATLDSLHALKQGAYSFMSTENANDTTRFTLVFKGESFVNENGDVIGGGGLELGLEEMVSRASYKVFVKGDELHLEANGKARIESVQIFDIQGKEVVYKNVGNTQKHTISNLNLQSGLYLVRLHDKYQEETVKVVIP